MPRIAYMQRPAVRPAALVRGRLNAFIHRCVHEARRKITPVNLDLSSIYRSLTPGVKQVRKPVQTSGGAAWRRVPANDEVRAASHRGPLDVCANTLARHFRTERSSRAARASTSARPARRCSSADRRARRRTSSGRCAHQARCGLSSGHDSVLGSRRRGTEGGLLHRHRIPHRDRQAEL